MGYYDITALEVKMFYINTFFSSANILLVSQPCRCANPPICYNDVLHASQTASQSTEEMGVGVCKGGGVQSCEYMMKKQHDWLL